MSTQPLITLIVTFYNEEKYLDECLASVARQDYPHLEILLMDDASTDSSHEIANRYAQRDPRMQLHRMETNGGIARLRNRALDLAQGEYIAWVDGDDWLDSNHISTLYETLIQAPKQPAIAVCPILTHTAEGERRSRGGLQRKHLTIIEQPEILIKLILDKELSSHLWNKLYPRVLFDRLRMPEGQVFEDFFLFPELIGRSSCLVCTDRVAYHYRLHASSIVHDPKPKNLSDLFCACRDRILFLRNNPPYLSATTTRMLEIYPLKMMHRSYHKVSKQQRPEAQSFCSEMEERGKDVGFKPYHGLVYSWRMFLLSLRKRYTETKLGVKK